MRNVDTVSEFRRVLEVEGRAILTCAERLDGEQAANSVRRTVEVFNRALDQGGKIVVTGIGKSGKVGEKIAATLSSTGSPAIFLHPTEGLHGDLGIVRPEDAVLAISYSGNTEELLRLIPSLKSRKVSIVGLGGNAESKLARASDVWLDGCVTAEACPIKLAPTTSTTLALALGDAIAVALMRLRGFNEDSFALNHPGGSIGGRLRMTVEDLMCKGDSVGVVQPGTSVDQVLDLATRTRLGGVLVTSDAQSGRLVGLITDGDIRRALRHREKFFQMTAGEIMTANPITVLPDMLAAKAFELMENRPSQLSVLPVVDSKGNWKGLLRLHDIVNTF